jgi:hypothetical protein
MASPARRLLPLLALVFAALPSCSSAQPEVPFCYMMESAYTVAIRQGPDAGMNITGAFGIEIRPNGDVIGLLRPDGTTGSGDLVISGHVAGAGVSLLFTFPDGRRVFGTGTATHDLQDCQGDTEDVAMGGTFSGPAPGDLGDWQCSTHGYVRASTLNDLFNGTGGVGGDAIKFAADDPHAN